MQHGMEDIYYVVEFGGEDEEPQTVKLLDYDEAYRLFESLKRVSIFTHVVMTRIAVKTSITVIDKKDKN